MYVLRMLAWYNYYHGNQGRAAVAAMTTGPLLQGLFHGILQQEKEEGGERVGGSAAGRWRGGSEALDTGLSAATEAKISKAVLAYQFSPCINTLKWCMQQGCVVQTLLITQNRKACVCTHKLSMWLFGAWIHKCNISLSC